MHVMLIKTNLARNLSKKKFLN